MNERIKALAVEADFALYEDGNFRSDPGQWINAELEKFAELIIRECLKDIETAAYHDSCEDWEYGYNSGLNKAKELIVSHFEVEE